MSLPAAPAHAKPVPLPVRPDGIPAELRDRLQWVTWKFDPRQDKWTKVPVVAGTSRPASTTNPTTWHSFAEVLADYQASGADGIGFVFAADDGFCGIDLDDCRDPATGIVADWAADIIRDLDGYAEVSPSGTGVKIIVKATLPGDGTRRMYEDGEVEIYDRGRYFALTGHDIGTGRTTIPERQEVVEQLYAKIKTPKAATTRTPTAAVPVTDDDAVILDRARRARNGSKFSRLFGGDTSYYADDHSRADAGLSRMLLFYVGGDLDRADALFRQSGLYRPKWDERRGAETYGRRTLRAALDGMTEFCTPNGGGGSYPRIKIGVPSANGHTADAKPATDSTLAFLWQPVNSTHFFAADYRPEWLVKNAIVRGQPLVCGAPQKTLKTTLMVDAGISIASATPWLGKFPVPNRRRVAVISGESGPFALQEIGRRVCRAKGINPADLGDHLHWQFRLPQLGVEEQLDALRYGLERDRIEVVVVDPLYLSLLAGSDARAENLFDIGPLLLWFTQTCGSVGATPILLHHTTKPTARKLEPLDLTDLAFSGVAEFARQWILLSRLAPYEAGSGVHRLWMVVGGSVGHSGLYALDVNEGTMNDDFTGRKWEVEVKPAGVARSEEKETKAAAKADERRHREQSDETAVIAALNRLSGDGAPVPFGRVRDLAGLNKDRMGSACERLIAAKTIRRCPVTITVGNGANRESVGLQGTPYEVTN
jgi:hypothetical protein